MRDGILALDIDGTLTSDYAIPKAVASALKKKSEEGWEVALITGRAFSFAARAIEWFDFPFSLVLQNGCDILHMPKRERLFQAYLPALVVRNLDRFSQGLQEDFLVYAGYEQGDFCYFRPEAFSPHFLVYLEKLQALSERPWQPVKKWEEVVQPFMPMIKAIGMEEEVSLCLERLRESYEVETCVIHDPLSEGYHLGLVTHRQANKGKALQFLMSKLGRSFAVVAGDDANDFPMLKLANVKIVMETAPICHLSS